MQNLHVRLLSMVLTLLGVTVITFVLMNTIPGGPFQEGQGGARLSPEVIAQLERTFGLDKPLWQQYFLYMGNVVRGDLGRSLMEYQSVAALIGRGLPVSAQLGGLAVLVAVLVGMPLGILAALRRNTPLDQFATGLSIIGICVPNFVVGLLLIIVFSIYLKWLPVGGWGTWQSLVMPVAALSLEPIALFTRYTRAAVLEVLSELYVTVARSKGLSEWIVVGKHVLKNALIPVVTVLGLAIPSLLVGSFLIETIFAIPGTGRFLVVAITQRDYPVIMGMALLYATIVVVVNMVVDVIYALLDPQIRF